MTNVMAKFGISKRIAFAMALPLLGLMVLVGMTVTTNYKDYTKSLFLGEIVNAVAELSHLTHKLQVERGRTAGFITGSSNTIPEALVKARQDVDIEAKKFHDVVVHLAEVTNADIVESLKVIDEKINNKPAIRSQVDNRSISLGDAMGFYSGLIKETLYIGLNSAELATDVKIALELVALLELGEAKEYAGQERGLVNGVLGNSRFTEAQYVALNQHIARQDLMIENFIASEPKIHREEYRELIKGTGIDEVRILRKRLIANKENTSVSGVTASQWFETTTNRINALRNIELKVIGDLNKETGELVSANRNSMILSSVFFTVLSIVTLIVAYFVIRSITGPLTSLGLAMKEISAGELEVEVEGQDLHDEIGEMSRALQVFKSGAIEKIRIEGESSEAREQAERDRSDRDAQRAKEAASISEAVELLGDGLDKLANGDLSIQINSEFGHGLDELRTNFNAAVGRLSETLTSVKSSIDTINTGTDEMKIASTELSGRTEQQAHSLQDVSSALEQITQDVNASAEDSSSAATLASAVRNETANSLEIVHEAVEAMNRIETASDQISSIISVIDEITFQTNLLALNAGVEAARAGDAGKGFAVVAQEVRELAHRSAISANEIKDLISASSKEVKEGVRHVTATGEALEAISEKINDISKSVESIAASSQRQSQSLNDCSQSANTLDQSTQQNAAMAEQATAVMQNLARDSNTLAQAVERFRLVSGLSDFSSRAA